LLEADWGDIVEVTVYNNITGPEEGTAMHWHGYVRHDFYMANFCVLTPG
jgi:FtsP/CotA-like multicopper oxidase with cupredoxin domain